MALVKHSFGESGPQSKLSDYVSNEREIMDSFASVEIVSTPRQSNHQNSQRNKILTPRTKISAYHLHRDLKSPIPNMRVLALQSIKNPLRNVLTQTDVPTQKRKSPDTDNTNNDPSIEEVMRNIVVYVEVRTGEDNRSAGVRKVIAALGARVSNTLCRTTTHVVFKDGLMSTYKKAKSMNIPIVSILWIEACKLQRKICDPAKFPISNLDRYENPELYEKMKRYKSMQPGSECNKRTRSRKQPKDSTPKSTIRGETFKSSQTDITRYFTQSNKNSPTNNNNNNQTPTRTPLAKIIVDSPATILLNRISSGAYTPINKLKQNEKETIASDETTPLNTRRNSIEKNINAATSSIAKMSICKMQETNEIERKSAIVTAKRQSFITRRTTIVPINLQQTDDDSMGGPSTTRSVELSKNSLHRNVNDSNKIRNVKKVSSSRRSTTYAYKPMDITISASETPSTSDQSKKTTMRRRTLFTPQKMLESPKISTSAIINSTTKRRTTIYTTPQRIIETETTPTITTNIEQCKVIDAETAIDTPPPRNDDEYMDCLSIDTPKTLLPQTRNRRRTLFDISMDIISHQVKHLNTKTHLTLTPSNADEINVPPAATSSSSVAPAPSPAPQPPPPAANVESSENSATTVMDKQKISSESTETMSTSAIADKKKRKLFAPPVETSPLFTPPTGTPVVQPSRISITNNGALLTTPKSTVKRRRTLILKQSTVPILNVPSNVAATANEKLSSSRSRRSTMDFEAIQQHIKSNQTAAAKDEEKEPSSCTETEAGKENMISSSKSQETIGDGNSKPASRKRLPFLAFTNMHKEQVEVINEAVAKLGKFKLDRTVCGQTTHMVSLEARRTMNILRGLVRGLWILDYKWITDSLCAGHWLSEEPYELKSFSRAVEICRAERQAFGNSYKCELFADLGAFFISPRCDNVPIRDLKELIRMCGGKVEEQRQNAKFILSSSTKAFDDKTYVTPLWILDSITQMQLMRVQKYSVSSELPTKQTGCNTRNMPTAIDMKDHHKCQTLEQINSNLKYSRKIKIDNDPSRIYSRTCTS